MSRVDGNYLPVPPGVSHVHWLTCHILLDRGASGDEIVARLGVNLGFVHRARAARAPYLREAAFLEADAGPTIKEREGPITMPSLDQIRRAARRSANIFRGGRLECCWSRGSRRSCPSWRCGRAWMAGM